MGKRLARFAAAGVATAGIAAAAVLGGAGSSYASTIAKGDVQLCAQGNYAAVLQFPDRGGYESTVVSPGQCWKGHMGGNGSEPINVIGIYNTSSNTFKIGTVYFNGSTSGIGIGAEGTTANAGAGAYLYTW